MKATNLKGALLEYLVRNLLKKCGFTNVIADNIYSFERGGLFFVNGKGAAHDADIIMNPPIQMPFTYPTQLIFECKAYGPKANLPIVRNAAGLRNDLNDFEIVTIDSLLRRQNNRRAMFAVESRRRFLFQVGVASVNDFSKPAVEFATNNKIPLLSLSWFLSSDIIADFNSIDQPLIDTFPTRSVKNLYDFLKDRNGNIYNVNYELSRDFLNADNIIGDIVTFANTAINFSYIGLLETGDMVFLYARTDAARNILNQNYGLRNLRAEIHWMSDRPNVWRLTISDENLPNGATDFDFFVPNRIFNYWKQFNYNKSRALDIKQDFFSKIFVFNSRNTDLPFTIININEEWLNNARENLNE